MVQAERNTTECASKVAVDIQTDQVESAKNKATESTHRESENIVHAENTKLSMESTVKKINEQVCEDGNDQSNQKVASSREKIECRRIKSQVKEKTKFQKDVEEMSTAVSEGSKSKIFGRIVDMMGQTKKRTFVPNTIIEEQFVVDRDSKTISSEVHKCLELNKTAKKTVIGTVKGPQKETAHRKSLSYDGRQLERAPYEWFTLKKLFFLRKN